VIGKGIIKSMLIEVGAICLAFGIGADEPALFGIIVSSSEVDEARSLILGFGAVAPAIGASPFSKCGEALSGEV